MSEILSQMTLPWANILLGKSKYYIHAYGSVITELAEIMGLTPDVVNNKLLEVDGFGPDAAGELDVILWDKIVSAFPGWSAQFITPYNNALVLHALSEGRDMIVLINNPENPNLAVRYIGNGLCHDPLTGTERPTSDFPDVKAFVVLTKLPEASKEEPKAPEMPNTDNPSVTLANLPLQEKNAILKQIDTAREEVRKLLAL